MGLKKFFRLKNTVPWTYVISDNKGEEFVGKFYDKELRKKKNLRIEKVIKRKDDRLYFKWKGYNKYF